MLCRKHSIIFQSNEPRTCAFCTFWGVGIKPKPPSGHHASVGTTQQSERLAMDGLSVDLSSILQRALLVFIVFCFYHTLSI